MARTLIASDDFNRADGGLGSNWSSINPFNGSIGIVSNKAYSFNAGGETGGAARWAGTGTFTDDQYAKVTVSGLADQNDTRRVGAVVRASADQDAAADYYAFTVSIVLGGASTYPTKLFKVVNGTATQLASAQNIAWVDGDTIELEVSGTSLTGYRNGVAISGFTAVTDSALTTGKPGFMAGSSNTNGFADNWEGGNVTSGAASPHRGAMLTGLI